MKYCTKCGKEVFDEAVICPHCGCSVNASGARLDQTGGESDAKTAQLFCILGVFIAVFAIPAIIYANKSEEKTGTIIKKAKQAKEVAIAELILWAVAVILINFI